MTQPRIVLLGGNNGRWSAADFPSQALTMNSGEAWVFAFDGDFIHNRDVTLDDIAKYDIVIANSDSFAVSHLARLAEKRPASIKWVTLLEGDALDYIKPRADIRSLLNASDLVNCINRHSLSFFRRLTSARVEYIGFPYPAEGIRSLSTPKADRRKEIFLAPMMLARWTEYLCTRTLGIPTYGYENRLTRKLQTIVKTVRTHKSVDPWHLHKKAKMLYDDPTMNILREEPLPEFFRRNGGAYLWLNLDQRYTWGRYVLDAAALQVPIITTASTGHAEHFFGATTVADEFDVDGAESLIRRLFADSDFYDEVATIPIEKFDHLRPEVKKQELLSALGVA